MRNLLDRVGVRMFVAVLLVGVLSVPALSAVPAARLDGIILDVNGRPAVDAPALVCQSIKPRARAQIARMCVVFISLLLSKCIVFQTVLDQLWMPLTCEICGGCALSR